ncbi:MAG: response regulator [Bdellovibrionaceae bacterium]|jgi:CheY-like chemotaxis protein|nr:response regulator [Pseudobdellovibrionaceae bacterium]
MSAKILVVDDEEDLRELFIMHLESEGLPCIQAECGDAAWDIFQNNNISLIITDYHMPKGNGIELLEKVREINKDIPLILLLTDASPEDVEKAKQLDISSIVAKPFDLEDVTAQVKKIL